MNAERVHELEQAIANMLRGWNVRSRSPRLSHLMAKAAMTVLEAAAPLDQSTVATPEKRQSGGRKDITWSIEDSDVAKVKAFIEQHQENAFVRWRIATNLDENKTPVTMDRFWEVMVGCLLTTQQLRSNFASCAVHRYEALSTGLLRV